MHWLVLLASTDCHLVVQKRDAADAVLPSKLSNILAVGGNAVITADPDTTLGKLCGGSLGDGNHRMMGGPTSDDGPFIHESIPDIKHTNESGFLHEGSYGTMPYPTYGRMVGRSSSANGLRPMPTYKLNADGGNRSADIGPSDLLPPYGLDSRFPGIAVCVEPESPEALVAGIRQALDMPMPNPVAQDYARRFLDKEEILGRFEGELVRLVEGC